MIVLVIILSIAVISLAVMVFNLKNTLSKHRLMIDELYIHFHQLQQHFQASQNSLAESKSQPAPKPDDGTTWQTPPLNAHPAPPTDSVHTPTTITTTPITLPNPTNHSITQQVPADPPVASPTVAANQSSKPEAKPTPSKSVVTFPKRALASPDLQHQPSLKSPTLIHNLIAWFTTGNPLLKVGVGVLFLGLAFLLRFASDYIDTPLWLRYLAVALSGLIATGVGFYLTKKRREYGLILQGFGLAVMYLTTLAALKLPQLILAPTAFGIMVLVVVAKIILAIRQDARILAQIALIGGLAAPILTSDGSGNYVLLFGYLAILNTGIAIIAERKAWRSLNAISLLGTFILTFAWQISANTEKLAEARTVSLLFGVYHVALYAFMVVFYAKSRLRTHAPLPTLANTANLSSILRHYLRFGTQVGVVDTGVLFGSALMGFVFLYHAIDGVMLNHASMWLAFGFAIGYTGFTLLTKAYTKRTTALAPLADAFVLLSLGFIALGIGLGLDDKLATGLLALQTALVYGYGLKQRLPQMRMMAMFGFLPLSLYWFDSYQFWDILFLGDVYGTLWMALAGTVIYVLWRYWQGRKASASWECYSQSAALVPTLWHIASLPTLVFQDLPMVAWSMLLMVIALGVWQYRDREPVAIAFAPLLAFWWLIIAANVEDAAYELNTLLMLLGGLGLLVLAYGLHLAPWQLARHNTPSLTNSASVGAGVLVLLFSLASLVIGFYDVYNHWFDNVEMTHTTWAVWSSFLVFYGAVLLVKRTNKHWVALARFSLLALPILSALLIYNTQLYTWYHSSGIQITLMAIACLALTTAIVGVQRFARDTHINLVHFVHLALAVITGSTLIGYNALDSARLWGAVALGAWAIAISPMPWSQRYSLAYRHWGVWFCFATATLWVGYVGTITPIVLGWRLPFVNVLDVLHLVLAFLLFMTLHPKNTHPLPHRDLALILAGGLGLFALSALVVRTWYFYAGTPWQLSALLADFGLQASLSLTWAVAGIGLMVWGARSVQRSLWLVGAALMGIVVAKLFLVELGNSGGVARIVSFIGVGLLLLVVGWFAPVPPKKQ